MVSIDIRTELIRYNSSSYYKLMSMFFAPTFRSLISRVLYRLTPEIMATIDSSSLEIEDWYFFKDRKIILRFGFLERPLLLPKYVTTHIFSLDFSR